MKKSMKRLLVIGLTLALMIGAISVVSGMAQGEESTTIEYEFTGYDADLAGYAEGTITITPGTASRKTGYYTLYWADDDSVLEDSRAIASVAITGNPVEHEMDYKLAIPDGATQVVVFETTSSTVSNTDLSKAAAVYSIPEAKRFSDTLRYSYALTSDVHIGCSSSYTAACNAYFSSVVQPAGYSNTAEYNWFVAMKYYAQTDAEFMISTGDLTDHARQDQYDTFFRIFEDSGFEGEIYTVNGNHDNVANFEQMTGNEGLYYEKTVNGDHYLMLGMSNNSASTDAVLTPAELDWLEEKLEEYSGDGHNIFIVMHPHIGGYTPGDQNPPTHGSPMNMNGTNVARLVSLLEKYPQSVYINGHTHVILEAGLNYGDREGTTARMIHVPSTGAAKTKADNLRSANDVDQSYVEGYMVSVYEENIVFIGVDLTTGKTLPEATYIIPTSLTGFNVMVSGSVEVVEGTTGGIEEGEKVELTLAATSQNYIIDTVKVSNVDEFDWDAETGKLTFTMPASAVSVTVTVKRDPSTTTTTTTPSKEEPEKQRALIGDVNQDETINAVDATRILLSAVDKITLDDNQKLLADVNEDETVNAMDATMILLHAVGKKPISGVVILK